MFPMPLPSPRMPFQEHPHLDISGDEVQSKAKFIFSNVETFRVEEPYPFLNVYFDVGVSF